MDIIALYTHLKGHILKGQLIAVGDIVGYGYDGIFTTGPSFAF